MVLHLMEGSTNRKSTVLLKHLRNA